MLENKKFTISIIVPIYKVEQYLQRCVDSLLKQTYENFELILVDDGSPDSCGDICDEYARQDSRIQVIHKENGGLSDARNAGMDIATGEYIVFVDSDDWVVSDYLESMLEALEETDSDICECQVYRTTGEEYTDIKMEVKPEVYDTIVALNELIHDGVFRQHVWNKLYRREVVGDIRFPKGKTNEDEFWTYQVFGRARQAVKIDDVLYCYYQRSGSIMGQGYSLKRLHALEAKVERQTYIDKNYPGLSVIARLNLYFSCMYAAQMSLEHMAGEDLSFAKNKIEACVKKAAVEKSDGKTLTGKTKIWFTLSRWNFWETCKLRNALKIGF